MRCVRDRLRGEVVLFSGMFTNPHAVKFVASCLAAERHESARRQAAETCAALGVIRPDAKPHELHVRRAPYRLDAHPAVDGAHDGMAVGLNADREQDASSNAGRDDAEIVRLVDHSRDTARTSASTAPAMTSTNASQSSP